MKHIHLLLLIFIALALSACGMEATHEQAPKSPNIIFILTDDQGWTHTSHRADPDIPESQSDYYETPNMDILAQSGVMFTRGYAPNPICSPTRNSMMFGQNGARHIYNKDADWYKKTEDWLTLPKAVKLGNPDYKTAHFGKWHIAMEPKAAGFEYDEGLTSNAAGERFGDEYISARDYTKRVNEYLKKNNIPNPTGARKVGKPSMYWSDENPKDMFGLTRRAMDFMKASIEADKPFYVQISHYATHLSLVSQPETYAYFKEKKKGKRHSSTEFAAMLKDMDTSVGMVMDFVKAAGIEDNTYIVLMGDNGGRLSLNQIGVADTNKALTNAFYSEIHNRNYPLRDGKHSFYEGGLRVPFMIAGPGIQANTVSDVPVTGLDFLPTFAELAGYSETMPDQLDGGSLVSLLMNPKTEEVVRTRDALMFHQSSHRKPRTAIIKGNYKLIKYWSKETKYKQTPKVELFDISQDLSETTDLAVQLPAIRKALEAEMLAFLNEVNAETGVRDIDGAFYRLKDDLGRRNMID